MNNALKRSILHLFFGGKWKTILLIITMTAVSVLLLITLAIMQAAKTSEKNLDARLMTTFMLQQDAYNPDLIRDYYFYEGPKLTNEVYDTIRSMDEITDSNRETQGVSARLEFCDRMDLLPNNYYMAAQTEDWSYTAESVCGVINNLLASEELFCYGNENTRLSSLFTSGRFELVEGRHILPDDDHVILLSKNVADLNGLNVGDTLRIGRSELSVELVQAYNDFEFDPVTWHEEMIWMRDDPDAWDAREFTFAEPFQIIGLYQVEVESTNDYLESEILENLVLMDYSTMEHMKELSAKADGTVISDFTRSYYYDEFSFEVRDASLFDKTIQKIKEDIPDSELFRWTTNADIYRAATVPLQWIGRLMHVTAAIIVCAGVLLCTLIALFWSKSRKREVGILLSTGEKKRNIILQLLAEGVIITMIAVLLSIPVSVIAIRKIDTASVLTTAASETDQEELLAPVNERPVTGSVRWMEVTNRNFTPERLDLSLKPAEIVCGSGIIFVSVCVALLLANIGLVFKQPRRIMEENWR